jgi:hypothetical protein
MITVILFMQMMGSVGKLMGPVNSTSGGGIPTNALVTNTGAAFITNTGAYIVTSP